MQQASPNRQVHCQDRLLPTVPPDRAAEDKEHYGHDNRTILLAKVTIENKIRSSSHFVTTCKCNDKTANLTIFRLYAILIYGLYRYITLWSPLHTVSEGILTGVITAFVPKPFGTCSKYIRNALETYSEQAPNIHGGREKIDVYYFYYIKYIQTTHA